jgi:ribose 5-phosphate isomerase RpiB
MRLMAANGQVRELSVADGEVLRWARQVVSAEDLRQALNGQRELILSARAVITPLAAEQIRATGIRVSRRAVEAPPSSKTPWGFAQERPDALVQSAIQAVHREEISLAELKLPERSSPAGWARAVADCIAWGEYQGGVVFCEDGALFCCVANKVAGLRAAVTNTVAQAARATLSLGANVLAVEMPGRTFFEVRQIIRTCCAAATPACPPGVACTLQELDSHAHC